MISITINEQLPIYLERLLHIILNHESWLWNWSNSQITIIDSLVFCLVSWIMYSFSLTIIDWRNVLHFNQFYHPILHRFYNSTSIHCFFVLYWILIFNTTTLLQIAWNSRIQETCILLCIGFDLKSLNLNMWSNFLLETLKSKKLFKCMYCSGAADCEQVVKWMIFVMTFLFIFTQKLRNKIIHCILFCIGFDLASLNLNMWSNFLLETLKSKKLFKCMYCSGAADCEQVVKWMISLGLPTTNAYARRLSQTLVSPQV